MKMHGDKGKEHEEDRDGKEMGMDLEGVPGWAFL